MTLSADDLDGDEILFQIYENGNYNNELFQIGKVSGDLYFKQAPNFESVEEKKKIFKVEVISSSKGKEHRLAQETIQIVTVEVINGIFLYFFFFTKLYFLWQKLFWDNSSFSFNMLLRESSRKRQERKNCDHAYLLPFSPFFCSYVPIFSQNYIVWISEIIWGQ